MPGRKITALVIHCSASKDGVSLARKGRRGERACTAAETIDRWHAARGFARASWRLKVRPDLKHIGYHYVIDVDGTVEAGREPDEIGAHVKANNACSIGICLVGTERFTAAQWAALRALIGQLRGSYPQARVLGHRDFSPDRNHDGRITRDEWLKTCPGFEVGAWVAGGFQPPPDHLFDSPSGGTNS